MKCGRVFVTGASGFVGKALVRALVEHGHSVIAYSPRPVLVRNVTWISGDIRDAEAVRRAAHGCDSAVHLAAICSKTAISNHPDIAFDTNVIGTSNVLEACHAVGIRNIVFASSGKVYGTGIISPASEEHMTSPSTPGGLHKYYGECMMRKSYTNSPTSKFVSLRMFNIYGPQQSELFLVPKLVKSLQAGFITLGDLAVQRDFVHVTDVVAAILIALDQNRAGFHVFNVGSGVGTTVSDLVDMVCEIGQRSIKVEMDLSHVRNDEAGIEFANIAKIKGLGWKPAISLPEGLSDLIYK